MSDNPAPAADQDLSTSADLSTWTTPLGVRLTVAGRGGPWKTITPHSVAAQAGTAPLKIPLPPGVDAGFYYRNGWNPAA